MGEQQLSKGKFNLVELVNGANGYYIAGKPDIAVKPELLGVFVIKDFAKASAQKLMLEELSWLNGGYKNREILKILPPPEGANAYSFGTGVRGDLFGGPNDYFFFPVVYCRIDESYLE